MTMTVFLLMLMPVRMFNFLRLPRFPFFLLSIAVTSNQCTFYLNSKFIDGVLVLNTIVSLLCLRSICRKLKCCFIAFLGLEIRPIHLTFDKIEHKDEL